MRVPEVSSRIGGDRRDDEEASSSPLLDNDDDELAATSNKSAGSPLAGHSARYFPHGELQSKGASSFSSVRAWR
jgi:hypothetical protein